MSSTTVAVEAKPPRWRGIVAIALLVLGGVLLPVSGVAVWVRNMLLDTDRYVETVKPLADDPLIVDASADAITNALFNAVDVEGVVAGILPGEGTRLAAAIAAQVESFVNEKATEVLESDQFDSLWIAANTVAHTQVKNLLLGNGNAIVLDLQGAIEKVVTRLDESGITFFDNIPIANLAAKFELFQSDNLDQARDFTDVLQKVANWLPILALACLIASVFVATNRRKGVKRVGWAIVIGSAVLLIALALGRSQVSNAIAAGQRRAVADTMVETVTRYLRNGIRTAFVIGVVIVAIAWIVGPGKNATKARALLVGHGGDAETSRLRQVVGRYRTAIIGGITVVATAILMSFDRLRPRDILIAAIIVGVLVIVVMRVGSRAVVERGDETTAAESPDQPDTPQPSDEEPAPV